MNGYTKAVVDLVKEVGVSRLIGYDGRRNPQLADVD
jgi:hypothetical protein